MAALLSKMEALEAKLTDLKGCEQECDGLDGASLNSGYAVDPPPTGDNLLCRLLHVSRALTEPSECVAALGGAPCR